MYLVSRLVAPGQVKETGRIATLFFGSENGSIEKLKATEAIFRAANLQATYAENIAPVIWEKFIFISTIATLTSYLDRPIGAILEDAGQRSTLQSLLHEIYPLAIAKGISLPEDLLQKTMEKFAKLPYETTSSMHSDFQKGKTTELESLTGYVVRECGQHGLQAQTYERLYKELLSRARSK